MRTRILLGVLVVVLTSLTSGCGVAVGILAAFGSRGSSSSNRDEADAKVDRALAARDFVVLQRQCSGADPVGRHQERACALAAMVEAEDTKDCKRAIELLPQGPESRDFLHGMGKKLAGCDEYQALFELIVHYNDGHELLSDLEKEGKPVKARFVEYAKSHAGAAFLPIEHAADAMTNINRWLLAQGHEHECKMLGDAVNGASETVRWASLGYFRDAGCRVEGVAIATDLLTSDSAGKRRSACEVLGELGDASHSGKLATLAETDGYSELQEEQGSSGATYASRVYPVRDSCRAAVGKIALRAK